MTITINGSGTITGATTLASTVASPTMTTPTLTTPTMTGAVVSSMGSSVITSGTAVASTSGTSIDFTSIPSWVKRITVLYNGVSTNGSSVCQVQLGAGSVTTSGYTSGIAYTGSSSGAYASTSSGFADGIGSAAAIRYGELVLTNISGNSWIAAYNLMSFVSGSVYTTIGGGVVTLSGTIDRVRVTTVNGTDAFDAGSINILYE